MGKSILSKIAIAAAMQFPASGLLGGSVIEAKVVKGQVTSAADGEALIGATVKLEESTAATVTDLDGNFQINAEDGQHIVVSYIGYVTKTVTVRGDFLAIKLDEEASTLDDVVVIGYGVQKKKLVTGATTQLKGEDIAKLNTNNALQAMQGQTPGVNIISESGQPGPVLLGEFGANWRSIGDNQDKHDASVRLYHKLAVKYAIDNGMVPMVWDINVPDQNGTAGIMTIINRADCSLFGTPAMEGINEGLALGQWPQ